MIFIFLFVIIALLFLYILFNRCIIDFSDPIFLCFAGSILSVLLVIANYKNWDVKETFTIKTAAFLSVIQVVFLVGYFLSRMLYEALPKQVVHSQNRQQIIYISNGKIVASLLLVMVSGAMYFVTLLRNSGVSYTNYVMFMEELRPIIQNNEANIGILPIQMLALCKVTSYGFSYAFIWNFVSYKKVEKKLLLVPILYILVSLLTSGRNYFLEYIVYVYVTYFLLAKKKKHFTPIKVLGFIAKIVLSLAGVLVIFVLLANLVGRNTSHSFFTQISVYLGGPLISFSEYFNSFDKGSNQYFGQESLVGVYQFLDMLGITDAKLIRHLEFIQFGDNWGNVYTAFRRYINDFGIIGCCVVVFAISFLYEIIYQIVINKPFLMFGTFLLAMFMYPMAMMIIDDLLLSRVLSINTVLEIGYSIIVFGFLIKRGLGQNEKCVPHRLCTNV